MVNLVQLETQQRDLLSHIAGWSEQRLCYRTTPDCWSAAQIFDHLVKTEESILNMAKRGLLEPHRIGITDRARTAFLNKIFESERQVKVPAFARQVLPDAAPDIAAIVERWQAARQDLASFHSQLTPAQMRQGIFQHPVGGWMGLPGVIDFFSVHMVHHTFQLVRLNALSHNL